jgi:hypothetical protein
MRDFGLKFSKRRQLIVGSQNETLSIAMRVCNPRSLDVAGVHRSRQNRF